MAAPLPRMCAGSQHALLTRGLPPRWSSLVSGFAARLGMAVAGRTTTTPHSMAPFKSIGARVPAAMSRTVPWLMPWDPKRPKRCVLICTGRDRVRVAQNEARMRLRRRGAEGGGLAAPLKPCILGRPRVIAHDCKTAVESKALGRSY